MAGVFSIPKRQIYHTTIRKERNSEFGQLSSNLERVIDAQARNSRARLFSAGYEAIGTFFPSVKRSLSYML